jgi:hypothetical protein
MPRVRRPNTSASTCRRPERWATRDIDTPGQGQRGRAPTGSSRRLHPSAIGRVRSAGPVGTQPQQRRAQVRDEHPERPLECRGPADHYVVASFCRIRRQHDPGGLAKPSPNSVPRHCVADFAARRNPQPNIGRSLLHAIPIVWLQYLQDQPGRCPRAPFAGDTHELGPTLQAWNNRWHGRFRRKGACALVCAEPPRCGGRRRSPCDGEIHAAVCERSCSADKSASRTVSNSKKATVYTGCPRRSQRRHSRAGIRRCRHKRVTTQERANCACNI